MTYFRNLYRRILIAIAAVMPAKKHIEDKQVEPPKIVRPVERRIPIWYGLFPPISKEQKESAAWANLQPWNNKGSWQVAKRFISKAQDERESQ